jgi:hypothetical protein
MIFRWPSKYKMWSYSSRYDMVTTRKENLHTRRPDDVLNVHMVNIQVSHRNFLTCRYFWKKLQGFFGLHVYACLKG